MNGVGADGECWIGGVNGLKPSRYCLTVLTMRHGGWHDGAPFDKVGIHDMVTYILTSRPVIWQSMQSQCSDFTGPYPLFVPELITLLINHGVNLTVQFYSF